MHSLYAVWTTWHSGDFYFLWRYERAPESQIDVGERTSSGEMSRCLSKSKIVKQSPSKFGPHLPAGNMVSCLEGYLLAASITIVMNRKE